MRTRFEAPFFDVGSGIKPPDGAQLFFSETGESFDDQPKDTFTSESGPTANANPVEANSVGLFPDIWISGRQKVVLKDKNNVQIWSTDPVIGSNSGEIFETVADMIANFGGVVGDLIETKGYYTAGGPGSAKYLIEASQSVDEFGDHTLDDGNVAILQKPHNGLVTAVQYGATTTIDSGPRLKAALDKRTVVRQGGDFRIDTLVSFADDQWLIGTRGSEITLTTTNDSAQSTRLSADGINVGIRDCTFVPLGLSGALSRVRSPVTITKNNFTAIRNFWKGSDDNTRFIDVWAFRDISSGDNFTVTNTMFDANKYTWCSNCIHELIGYTANNTTIKNELPYLTPGNYINFNGEKLDPDNNPRIGTSNLHISGVIAKDIGFAESLTGDLENSKERRFLATTFVDNLKVTDCIIDHVYGDSPLHIERPGKITIANNSFLNCHGALAKGISIEAGSAGTDGILGPNWDDPEISGSITGNTFDHRDSDNVSGQDSDTVIDLAGDATFENIDFSGNTFIWYEPGMYPQTPSIATVAASSLRGINFTSGNRGKRVVINNRFLNMDIGVQISSTSKLGGTVDDNFFRNCEVGILWASLGVRPQSMMRNEFKDCNRCWTIDEDFPPTFVGGNIATDCTSAELGILDPNWTQNIYDNVTTIDDPLSSNFTMTNTGAGTWAVKVVGKFARRMNGTINVRITRAAAGDTRISNFDYGFRTVGEFNAEESYTNELARVGAADSIPVIALTESGGSLSITLSGGDTDFDYFGLVKVNGIIETIVEP